MSSEGASLLKRRFRQRSSIDEHSAFSVQSLIGTLQGYREGRRWVHVCLQEDLASDLVPTTQELSLKKESTHPVT